MCIEEVNKMKKLWFGMSLEKWDNWDIGLFKLTLIAIAFFLVSVWSGLADWVIRTPWYWFFIAAIVLCLRPMIKCWKK